MLGSTAGTSETIQLNKASSLVFKPSTGLLSATTYHGKLEYALGITLNGAANATFNNSAAVTHTFFAPTTGGTSGNILKSNGNAAPT